MNDGSISAIVKRPLFTMIMLVIAMPMITGMVSGAIIRLSTGFLYAQRSKSVQASIKGAPYPIAK